MDPIHAAAIAQLLDMVKDKSADRLKGLAPKPAVVEVDAAKAGPADEDPKAALLKLLLGDKAGATDDGSDDEHGPHCPPDCGHDSDDEDDDGDSDSGAPSDDDKKSALAALKARLGG